MSDARAGRAGARAGARPGAGAALSALLTALVAFQAVSTDLYLPALPAIVADLGSDVATIQLTLSLFLIGFGLGQILWGPLSDRFGRRSVLLVALCAYAALALACALAPGAWTLVVLRLLMGVAAAAGPALGRAVVRDLWPPAEAARVLARLAAAMAVAPMLGPVVGGLLTELSGWRANFVALALFGGASALAAAAILPETAPARDVGALAPRRLLESFRSVLAHPLFRAAVLGAGLSYGGIFVWISASSHVLVGQLGLPPRLFGLVFATSVLGYMAGSHLGGRIAGRLGLAGTLRAGALLALTAGACALLAPLAFGVGVPALLLPAFLVMATAGFVLPTSMALAMAPFPERAGLASGLLGALQLALASGIGYAVAAALGDSAWPLVAGWLATTAATAAAALHLARRARVHLR